MKKAILLSIILIILGSCSSIPKNDLDNSFDTLIEKPNFNYQIKFLPEQFNIYYFEKNKLEAIPSEIQGFLANLYFYKNKTQYSPKIKIIPIKDSDCDNLERQGGFSIVFDNTKIQNRNAVNCSEILPKSDTLYITNHPKNLEKFEYSFLVSRESEKKSFNESN